MGDQESSAMGDVEIWRPMAGHPGYEVSNMGNARSLDRIITLSVRGKPQSRRIAGVPLNPSLQLGYRTVTPGGGRRAIKIAKLVLMTFVGPPSFSGAVVRHLNDIRSDDRLVNLAWGTRAQNGADAVRNGRMQVGESRPASKLTKEDVIAIRESTELTQDALAKKYGVSQALISGLIRGEGWRGVGDVTDRNGLPSHNTSGIRGVRWDKANKRWRGKVGHRGVTYDLGSFIDIREAEAAVLAKRAELASLDTKLKRVER